MQIRRRGALWNLVISEDLFPPSKSVRFGATAQLNCAKDFVRRRLVALREGRNQLTDLRNLHHLILLMIPLTPRYAYRKDNATRLLV